MKNNVLTKCLALISFLSAGWHSLPTAAGTYQAPVKKTFFTNNMLLNKIYPVDPIMKSRMDEPSQCQAKCAKMKDCFAFSHSVFAKVCVLFAYEKGMWPVESLSYTLYISEKSESDGFYKFGSNYIKLFYESLNAWNAQHVCNSMMDGMLVAVLNQENNDLLARIMDDRKVFTVYIGLTDEDEEMNWKYYNGATPKYLNWNYKGRWNTTEKNCAVIIGSKKWKQINCSDKLPFFCQIPYY